MNRSGKAHLTGQFDPASKFLAKHLRCAIILNCEKDRIMRKRSRLIGFILLNILISAVTTLTVLWAWERAHPRPEIGIMTAYSDSDLNPSDPLESFNDSAPSDPNFEFTNENILITIRTIVGAGDLAVEYVEIINQGENPANLTAWQLLNEDGQTFTFPALILNSGGAIKVLSRAGTDTVIELYWQSDAPIWRAGETARLLNASGEVVASYSIP
jgi:hypothetical protein